MMREGWFAPTLNLNKPDPNCGALDYIMHEARKVDCEFCRVTTLPLAALIHPSLLSAGLSYTTKWTSHVVILQKI